MSYENQKSSHTLSTKNWLGGKQNHFFVFYFFVWKVAKNVEEFLDEGEARGVPNPGQAGQMVPLFCLDLFRTVLQLLKKFLFQKIRHRFEKKFRSDNSRDPFDYG